MEDRIVELELRYMELKRLVEELSTVVAAHERALERIQAAQAAAANRMRELADKAEGPVADEKPPHY
jgi:uncharacterized coiled-coil protein SlyX